MAVGNPVASNAQPEIFSLGQAVELTVKTRRQSLSVLSFAVPMS